MRRAFFFILAVLFANASFASIPRVSTVDDASAIDTPSAETRVWASDVLAPFERQAESELTRALRQGYEQASTTNASGLGRFLFVDPVLDSVDPRRPQSWNRYAYSLNNPLTYLDPDGRTTVVFIVSSGSKLDEKGGHAAVWVESGNQRGGVSRGGYNIDKNGWNDFLAHYTGQGRGVHAYILKTTDAQDQAMLDFIKQEGPGGGTDANKSVQTCGLTENCASGVVNVLQAGGVVPANSDPSAARGANSPFVLKNELDSGQLKPQVQRHIDFVPPPPPKKESWWSRVLDVIF